MGFPGYGRWLAVALATLAAAATVLAWGSAPAATAAPGTCLILPFENRSGEASLDWIGESFVTALTASLRDGDAAVLNPKEQAQALALAGAPAGMALSHATLIRIADAADADWLVIGWYDYDGSEFRTGAEVFDLRREHLVTITPQRGPLEELESLQDHLGWALRQQLDPGAAAPAAVPPLPLPAYESYTRALLETTPAAKLKDLDVAVHFAPHDARVIFSLGEAYLAAHDEAEALSWLDQVPSSSPDYAQAQFSAGIAAYRLGRYDRAVAYFAGLDAQLPLPAVVADLALARARLAAAGTTPPPALQTEFPADGFRQLVGAVRQFDAAKLETLAPAQQVAFELDEGKRLQAQGGFEAAAKDFQAVIARLGAGPSTQAGAAHAGLAAIALARHDPATAAAEAAAALAADPDNAEAQTLQKQLAGTKGVPRG